MPKKTRTRSRRYRPRFLTLSFPFYREHYVKMHNVQYICPYENCPTKKYQRLKVDLDATTDKKDLKKEIFTNRGNLFDFARHVYYHEHVHPQLSMPHECIGNCEIKKIEKQAVSDRVIHRILFFPL